MAFVSVIIPVLSDQAQLERLLPTLGADPRTQIIVVTGGARDAMVGLERAAPHVLWLSSAPGRGTQMNVGASRATGEWLLFLHADTHLPTGWIEELGRAARVPGIVGGSFRFRLDSASPWARIIERGVAWRVRWFDLPYGDQALFVRRELFTSLGGYRDLPLMEDVDFVRRIRRVGRLHHSDLPAVTSARRWEVDGWIRRSAENVVLVLLFLAGVSPKRLATVYRRRGQVAASEPPFRAGSDG